MSLFDPWEVVDAARDSDDALFVEEVRPGDVIAETRRRVLRDGRFEDGRVWCLIEMETLDAMARAPGAHPDSNYLAEERSLETLLALENGIILRNYGTGEHVVFLDPSTVTLDHGLLDPSRVAILEVIE